MEAEIGSEGDAEKTGVDLMGIPQTLIKKYDILGSRSLFIIGASPVQ